jgi:hypothetical protein
MHRQLIIHISHTSLLYLTYFLHTVPVRRGPVPGPHQGRAPRVAGAVPALVVCAPYSRPVGAAAGRGDGGRGERERERFYRKEGGRPAGEPRRRRGIRSYF